MASEDRVPVAAIGAELRRARGERGLELRDVEAQTKIRLRYLRALEAEEWNVLPGPAYALGFLRTYATTLGLDAERLARELRARLEDEAPAGQRFPLGEPVLAGRERQGGPRPLLRLAILVVLALLLAGAAAWALGAFDEEEPPGPRGGERGERAGGRAGAVSQAPRESGEPVQLRLLLRDDVPVCLVGDDAQPLIDNQVLAAGSAEEFAGERFELRFPQGYDRAQVRLELDGRRAPLDGSLEPAAYRMGGGPWLRPVDARGGDCP